MDYSNLLETLNENSMDEWSSFLGTQLIEYYSSINHGDYPRWKTAVENLPLISDVSVNLNSGSVIVGLESECTNEQQSVIREQLKNLMPWRKGPFNLFGIDIDSEWRSNLKWNRLKDQIKPLDNKMVLDIGCGNGYYGWRMLGENAKYVVGMDPTLLFIMQFSAIKKYLPDANIDIIPLGVQTLPNMQLNFDTVFSMGVIYHRRDSAEHMTQLMDCLKSGGELVLETLVIGSDEPEALNPDGRYSKMRNVWSIPSNSLLTQWAEDVGFINTRIVDVTKTTSEEQRQTDWMSYESLSDFLDKEDSNKTVEGHPAPTRAILIAEKP
ncbi:MAG: tRNA (mo5U34)-methyltransferase [Gammaproteobacteria bacterium]|jgi:tRNA (mo5U34)-methyltransferase